MCVPVREVAVGPEVGVAERLEVRDLRRAEARLLRRREAEEQLRAVGDEVGTRRAAPPAPSASAGPMPPSNPPPDEALPDARHSEQAAQVVEERRRSVGDVVEDVAAEQHGDVVLLEQRRFAGRSGTGSRLRARGPGLPRLRRTAVEREMPLGLRGHEALEVRKPPGHRHAEAGGRRLEALVEPPERVLELRAGLPRARRRSADAQRRRDDLVVERRHEHLDAVVADDPDPVQKVLLGEARARPPTASAAPSAGRPACRCRPRRAPTRRRRRRRAPCGSAAL